MRSNTLRRVFVSALMVLVVLSVASPTRAQSGYKPTAENLASRQWFQDAKFGIFVHWGVYSVLGRGEWVMQVEKIPISEYEKLPPQFNPTRYDAAEWVDLAKAAGAKYITITSKHHDGFAMYDSKVSNYDIVERTPYKKDVLKMLADACHTKGVKLFFYHSQLDWHHPDYYPRGETGKDAGRPESGNWNSYIDYMNTQLTELLTNYGDIGGIWFDGMWDKPEANWRLDETYSLIHKLQPKALVGSNHHHEPFAGEDFQMFEKDLPGANTAGFNKAGVSALPLETCETINGAWGYNANDRNLKSTRQLVQYLARAAGNGANFLLNVGPRPDGTIQPDFVERLREMGGWLSQYGDSIYGTRGGPIGPRSWGVTTQKKNVVYVHVLDLKSGDRLWLPLSVKVASAKYLKNGSAAGFASMKDGILLDPIPAETMDPYDTVIAIELAPGS
jgi:alpha-L-fucosidase